MSRKRDKRVFVLLNEILETHAGVRDNGKVASDRTKSAYGEVLHMCFDVLHDLGYRIQNPRNLKEIHVKELCEHWYGKGRAVKTMQDYLSKLRVYSKWIGKHDMVKSLSDYLPDVDPAELKVRHGAIASKSWTENDIDIALKIREADAICRRFGLIVRMMLAFGLRRKEVLAMRPHRADFGTRLVVFPGEAKGGRPRDVFLDNTEQRLLLDEVKKHVRRNERLGWSETKRGKQADLRYCLRHYHYCMDQIGITKLEAGVTGHGCRAQYAENAALLMGVIPPTLGGKSNQMAKDELDTKREQVAEQLGHSRKGITSPYYGSFGRGVTEAEVDKCRKDVLKAIPYLGTLQPVPEEYLNDCLQIVKEMEVLDVDLTPRQACALWKEHSRRFVTPLGWAILREGNAETIQAAANSIAKKAKR